MFCLFAVYGEAKSLEKFVAVLHEKVTAFEVLRIAVPSILYLCQNNMVYYAISNLDAALFSIVYQVHNCVHRHTQEDFEMTDPLLLFLFDMQSKILTTAFFAVLILKKKFSSMQ